MIEDSALAAYSGGSWQKALAGSSEKAVVTLDRQRYRYLLIPVEIDDRIEFVLQLAAPMTGVQASMRRLITLFSIAIPTALFLTALSAYLITSIAFRPMSKMVETAKQISSRNLDERLALPKARDEVRSLGQALNDMMLRIDEAFKSQRRFVAEASHEIRTPLTIIYSELEYAKRYIKEQEAAQSIDVSLSEIDRLTQMANRLLLLAKLDASQLVLHMGSVRLDELLVESIQLVSVLASKKDIDLVLHIEKAVELQADKERLKAVLLNLLDNAIKYSPPNSRVSVSLLADGETPGRVRIVIKDSGPGISQTELPHIFKRFYRASGARAGRAPGSGLGLAIAKQLVKLHGGGISVTSKMGEGASFIVDLPYTSNK